MAVFITSLGAQEAFNSESMVEIVKPRLKEMAFVVSLQDLTFDQGELSVNWEGNSYLISALEKEGDHWIARSYYESRYCLAGHNLCSNCRLCHLKGCRFYIPPCWQ